MTRAVLESMKLDSKVDLKHLKVDGGMTNGDMVMSILADLGGFTVIRPEMREYVHLHLPTHLLHFLTYTGYLTDQQLSALRFLQVQPSVSSTGTLPSLKLWLTLTPLVTTGSPRRCLMNRGRRRGRAGNARLSGRGAGRNPLTKSKLSTVVWLDWRIFFGVIIVTTASTYYTRDVSCLFCFCWYLFGCDIRCVTVLVMICKQDVTACNIV